MQPGPSCASGLLDLQTHQVSPCIGLGAMWVVKPKRPLCRLRFLTVTTLKDITEKGLPYNLGLSWINEKTSKRQWENSFFWGCGFSLLGKGYYSNLAHSCLGPRWQPWVIFSFWLNKLTKGWWKRGSSCISICSSHHVSPVTQGQRALMAHGRSHAPRSDHK